jgi:hypothetical protein
MGRTESQPAGSLVWPGYGGHIKGIVFSLLQEVVTREYGEDAWDDLLDAAGLEGVYTSPGSYPDEEFHRLAAAASVALDRPPDDVIRWFGRNALHLLAEAYPQLFTSHASTRPFLLTLNDIIHPEVRKLYPGADVPIFDYDTSSPDVLRLGYRSKRQLCVLGEGLIQGAADYYHQEAVVEQPRCARRGDDHCVFAVSFRS